MPDPTSVVDVLLVEDNPSDAELCIRALKRHSLANRLLWVKDGAEALDALLPGPGVPSRLGSSRPKVILLDLRLPKVDGIEVLRRLRSDDRTKTLPIVIVTSSKEDRDVAASYKLGANSYISKPVEFDKFADVVGQLGLYWLVVNKPPVAPPNAGEPRP